VNKRAICSNCDGGDYQKQLDDVADIFSEETGFERVITNYKMRSIRPHLCGKSLLDVGCGVGLFCNAFADFFERVVGIDGSSKKILKAKDRKSKPNITYIETLAENFRPGRCFDTILAANVLEHVKNPVQLLRYLRELLSADGRIIITVPHALGLHKRIGKIMGLIHDFYEITPEDIRKGHRRIYDKDTLIADLEAASLIISSIEGVFLKPLSHRQMESWDVDICDALYEIGKELPDYCSSLLAVARDPSKSSR
jgi:2-polyprenyl-3-methyl-5-hydroxy-6-metoxy-1,4-benzoquinol methylase